MRCVDPYNRGHRLPGSRSARHQHPANTAYAHNHRIAGQIGHDGAHAASQVSGCAPPPDPWRKFHHPHAIDQCACNQW